MCACDQSENQSSRARANHTETGSWRAHMGTSVGSTKDRDVPALGGRAQRVAVGRTNHDNVGFLAAPTGTELKWPRELSGELTASVLRQRLGYGHCCSDLQKSHRKPPENKSLEILVHIVPIPTPPRRGPGNSTQTGLPEYQRGSPLPPKGRLKSQKAHIPKDPIKQVHTAWVLVNNWGSRHPRNLSSSE